jgi:DNA (cytosine-5)-methyltransferase 1
MQSFNDQANPPPYGLIIDNFAGGGGASTGIEMALGRSPDIAINHDPEALTMHEANHPETIHLCENVWQVDIAKEVAGRHVALAWFSPDCKHFSKAKGGKPVEKNIRGLAWVVLKWAGIAKPDVIVLENVEEFQTWGPLVDNQPCPRRKGMTFRRWVTQLRNLGYRVDWRELRACDYGAPTIRKRLFVIARRDGRKIVWPEPTHGPAGNLFLQPYRTAAECIDWSIPCPSIFGRKRPLAEATLRRIALGLKRYVIEAKEPFIVNMAHGGKVEPMGEPMSTIATEKGGCRALVAPTLIQVGYGEREGQSPRVPGLDKPMGTLVGTGKHALVAPILVGAGGSEYSGKPKPMDAPYNTATTENHTALVSAFLAKHYGGVVGSDLEEPIGTVTAVDHHSLVSSHIVKLKGTCKDGHPVTEPMATVGAMGTHLEEVRAFLIKYFGTDQDPRLEEPLHTVTAKHRFGLVTIHGEPYQIVDIGMRMLTPRELFRAQGFPDEYKIDPIYKGKPLTKTSQVRMCGNSVAPPVAAAIIRANFGVKAMEKAA